MFTKIEFHFGELFPRGGLIVNTSRQIPGRWYGSTTSGEPQSNVSKQADRREDHTAEPSPIPPQRRATVAEPHRVQPREHVASAGGATQDRELVAD